MSKAREERKGLNGTESARQKLVVYRLLGERQRQLQAGQSMRERGAG